MSKNREHFLDLPDKARNESVSDIPLLSVRGGKRLRPEGVRNLLIRGTNWIGDVVMTLPAIASIRKTFPDAHIAILVKPWVADVLRLCPDVDEILLYKSPGIHAGMKGKVRLAGELRERRFDAAILLQNAIEAAILTRMAGIPIRAGYNSDARGALLTHAVRRTREVRQVHQVNYYRAMVQALGCEPTDIGAMLKPGAEDQKLAERLMSEFSLEKGSFLVGMAPGAAYGPAKMWFPERFGAVADRLISELNARVLLFGSSGDRKAIEEVQGSSSFSLLDLAGKTSLREAIVLMSRCGLFVSNDSGLMHVAGALGVPTVAIFGSTNPVTTSPSGKRTIVVRGKADCSPCLKKVCPTDFQCMKSIGVEDVYRAARTMMKA
ncbi:lipopolysaccharide heptosyltransferase II [Syntrophus gentianae]|uniref:lipopolysaccharide heptosyltransferase II n=1 Tax=Syntrophus gentianae TaxID=43775 RepID=UPI000B88106B|nr:lipopolysaccharide heptosyltransferase II [Syntrophus gentianae]